MALLVLLLAARPGDAQNRPNTIGRQVALVDSTPARSLLSGGTKNFPTWLLVDILRQKSKPLALSKRRELADSLVARAIQLAKPDEPPLSPSHAVEPLVFAGMAVSSFGGTPDRDALNGLIEIHRDAQLTAARLMAIGSLEHQVDPARALPYLMNVVLSPDGTRFIALAQMIGMAQNPSLSAATQAQATDALRELYDSERVAVGELCRFAARHNWPRRSGGRICAID